VVKSTTGTGFSPKTSDIRRNFVCGRARKSFQLAQPVHHPQGRGVNRVAAKVAQEIGVLFQHRHADARPRQQVAQHQPRRAAAGNRAGGRQPLHARTMRPAGGTRQGAADSPGGSRQKAFKSG
jgi:hypothetical protein